MITGLHWRHSRSAIVGSPSVLVLELLLAAACGKSAGRAPTEVATGLADATTVEPGDAAPDAMPAPPEALSGATVDAGPQADVAPETAAEAPAPRPTEPTRAVAGARACSAAEPIALGQATGRKVDLAVAFAGPDRGLVLWSMDSDHLRARAVTTELGAPIDAEVRQANRMEVLTSADDGFLLLTAGPLCDPIGNSCFRTCLFRADGTPAGDQQTEILRDQDAVVDAWLATADGFVAAQSLRWMPARIAQYRVVADGTVAVETLGEVNHESGDLGVDALAADDSRLFVLTRPDDEVSATGRTVLVLPGEAPAPFHDLPAEIQVLHFSATPEGLLLFYRVGGGRARLARFSPQGRLAAAPAIVARGEPLPEPVRELVRFELENSRGSLLLRRSDVAAQPLGDPFALAKVGGADIAYAVAWTGRDFAVVWAVRSSDAWTVSLRRVRCDGAGQAPG